MPKKLAKKKIREAVRVVGYLLETNGTTKVFARTKSGKPTDRFGSKACKFCLAGAADVVAVNVLGIDEDDSDRLEKFEEHVNNVIKRTFFENPDQYPGPINYWDNTTKLGRSQIAMALRKYSDRA